MLSRIVALLDERGTLTVDELVRATGVSRDALEGMLETLQRRRRIVRQFGEAGSACSTCRAETGQPVGEAPTVTLTLPRKKTNPRQNRG